jgi:hypothetical protein
MARNGKKGAKKAVLLRKVADPVFKCNRMLTFNITRPASDSGTTRTINLNLLPGVSDFTSLFQHYRIKSVNVTWILVNGLNANNVFPTLTVAPQHHSSAVVPLTRDAVSQYHGVKVFQFAPSKNTFSKRYDVYGPMLSVLSGQQYEKAPWYRCEDATIPCVYAVEFITRYNNTDTPNHLLECIVTADVEFKGTK